MTDRAASATALLAFLVLFICSALADNRGSVALHFPDSYSLQERSLTETNIRQTISIWESDFQCQVSKPIEILVAKGQFKTPGLPWTLDGLYQHSLRRITVWAGPRNEVPALYHELCHLHNRETGAKDRDHEDKRWRGWDKRGRQIAQNLATNSKTNGR